MNLYKYQRKGLGLLKRSIKFGTILILVATVLSSAVSIANEVDLTVEYRMADSSATDNQMKPHFRIVNSGSTSVPLSEFTIRYWYTKGSTQSEQFNCDWSPIGCSNISGQFVSMSTPQTDADAYMEISFGSGAGSLAAGGNSGEIQARINRSDWSNYNESDDYSYKGTQTAFALHDKVTLYRSGQLVWGAEPGVVTNPDPDPDPIVPTAPMGVSTSAGDGQVSLSWSTASGADSYIVKRSTTSGGPYTNVATGITSTSYTNTGLTNGTTYYYVVSAVNSVGESTHSSQVSATPQGMVVDPPTGDLVLQYRAADTNAGDGQFKPHFRIVNNGSNSVNLSELTIRYWYTIDGQQGQTFNCDYAAMGCANVNGSLVQMGTALTGADHYLEVSFTSGAGSIAAGSNSGEIQTRNYKNNWSSYNESDDYSFDQTKTAFTDWDRLTLYRNGTLIWGYEPKGNDGGDGGDSEPIVITGETTIVQLCPNFKELYIDRTFLDYPPGDGSGGHGDYIGSHGMTDMEKAALYGFDSEAVQNKVGDGSLQLKDLGSQALGHVLKLDGFSFPRDAVCKLLPRLALIGSDTEPPAFHKNASNPWQETSGPAAASNNPPMFIQQQWPTDARTYVPEEKAERDRIHDQPQHESNVGWTFLSTLGSDKLYDTSNPVLEAIRNKVHPVTNQPLGGQGFTSNAPMEVTAKIHEENEGFWYQVMQFKNTSDVPYHLDGAVIWWIGPSSMSFDLRNGHYNNGQRPGPGYGHPQRDIIEVVYDEDKQLSAYVIRLAFHDEPYNMRTAYPNQYWSLEVGVPAKLNNQVRYTTSEERQAVVDRMVNTLHVELETNMDRNIDLLDILKLRNRVSN
jgi:hypothetical protein